MYRKYLSSVIVFISIYIRLGLTLKDSIYPFQNTSLPLDERVDDLVSRLTPEEIITLLGSAKYVGQAPGIPRLNISPYNYLNECLRGIEARNSTAFPQSIGLGATWNKELIGEIANAIGYELRAYYIMSQQMQDYGPYTGLSCFSPMINIMRHPLWGRNQESYGECPYLSGATATYYINGFQGNHSRYILASTTCKHFDAYGGPENPPKGLGASIKVNVTETDWRSTFLPQFKACVDAGAYSLMCSYNSINGIPACANKKLLNDIARDGLQFKGYIISDSGALMLIYRGHQYANSTFEAAVDAINAGVNLELCWNSSFCVYDNLFTAYNQGIINDTLLRQRVRPLYYLRMRLGDFDPHEMNPYWNVPPSVIQSQEHRDLALYAAMQSLTLLKNQKNYLPLKQSQTISKKAAFIGPMSDNLVQQYGDYAAPVEKAYASTPYQSLSSFFSQSTNVSGCDTNACLSYNSTAVIAALKNVDIIILSLGTGQQCEREGLDRTSMNFPNFQHQLYQDVLKYADSDTDIIILLFNAGPLNITEAISASNVRAILECYLPAQSGGEAIRRVLYNDGYGANPAGRLPFTWPLSLDDVPPILDYSMTNRTYRYSTATPLFYFGYGLSYSTFTYSSLNVASNSINAGDTLSLSVTVQNSGPYAGDEVVQVYIVHSSIGVNFTVPHANIQLVAYERVYLNVNQAITLNFKITPQQMSIYYDPDEQFIVFPGTISLYAGGNQPRQSSENVLSTDITVNGYYQAGAYVSYANNLSF